MASHRTLRIAEAIREVVSSAVLFQVADPRVRAVTVLRVEVGGEMRNATVYVSVMGTEVQQQSAMAGLKSAAGFIQTRVAERLQTRFTPVLTFKRDDSVKKSIAISRLIEDALAEDRQHHPDPDAETEIHPETDADDEE
jgi:ribosome-binding factor A